MKAFTHKIDGDSAGLSGSIIERELKQKLKNAKKLFKIMKKK